VAVERNSNALWRKSLKCSPKFMIAFGIEPFQSQALAA
jgi:hypothetical protein